MSEKKPTATYLICAIQRTGSNLLCEGMRNTHLAGIPNEYFHFQFMERFGKRLDVPYETDRQYISAVVEKQQSPNGVFGAKLMYHDFQELVSRLRFHLDMPEGSDKDVLEAYFPNLHFIYITRKDKVRQAISWVKAAQTSAWTSEQTTQSEKIYYDPDRISELMNRIRTHERGWERIFKTNGIEPFRIQYEQLSDSYETFPLEILEFMNVPVTKKIEFGERSLKKQADQTSEEWYQRYIQEYGNRLSEKDVADPSILKQIPSVQMNDDTDETETDTSNVPLRKSYVICAIERTGSNLLCEGLRLSRSAGVPNEYFNPYTIEGFAKNYGVDPEDYPQYIAAMIARTKSPNGVVGIKVMWEHFLRLISNLRKIESSPHFNDLQLLKQYFPSPKFIFITRRDKVRQAISWVKADQSSAWTSNVRVQNTSQISYDGEAIQTRLRQIIRNEKNWEEFFARFDIEPMRLVYEDFTSQKNAATLKTLEYLEIPVERKIPFDRRKLNKQADAISEQWYLRYIYEQGLLSESLYKSQVSKLAADAVP